jgi:hypothetical protein
MVAMYRAASPRIASKPSNEPKPNVKPLEQAGDQTAGE